MSCKDRDRSNFIEVFCYGFVRWLGMKQQNNFAWKIKGFGILWNFIEHCAAPWASTLTSFEEMQLGSFCRLLEEFNTVFPSLFFI